MKRIIPFIGAVALLSARLLAAELPKVARAFIESRCIECHDGETKKGGLNLSALSTELNDPPTEAKWTQIYDRVQRGEMPPKKEQQPRSETDGFMQSLGELLSAHDAARHASTGRVVLRRLNRTEYENSVHDLLAIDTPLAAILPEDASASGFDNVSEALRLSSTQIEAYLTAADAALDAAIDFGPKPEVKKLHLTLWDIPAIKEELEKPTGSLTKDGSVFRQPERALPDAVVLFNNELWQMILREAHADVAGNYRIRLSAYAYQAVGQRPVVARVMTSDFLHNRFGAAFDLIPDQPRTIDFTMRLKANEMFWLAASGCNVATDGRHVEDVGGETYNGTGMAVQWIEIEGPLLASWPPPSMHRVFGDIPLRQIDKPQHREIAYEAVSVNPAEDTQKVVTAFAERAFRRRVTPDEAASYIQLAHEALAQGASIERALRRAYKAILVSPEFLFLQERPGKLDDYALASRLSYFLWSTTPDDELLRCAAAGSLHDPATLSAQTQRLLADGRAAAFTRNFCGQWLNLRSIAATTPDQSLYPEFDELLKGAMVDETEAFFNQMLHEDLGVSTLIDSDFAMLNRRLAEHYGIPGVVGEQMRKVPLPPGSHRGGLLTQASILKVTANGTLSSPVVRGNWVMKRILGRQTLPPPADAGAIEPDVRGATTIREQLAKHRRSASCASCHKYMDPAGFALENYDVIGGWRDTYRTQGQGAQAYDPFTHQKIWQYHLGAAVDPTGELADGRKFQNIDGLKKLLLGQQDEVARNLVNNLIAYSTGAAVTFSDRAKVQDIMDKAKPHAYGLRTLVNEVVQSPLFQCK